MTEYEYVILITSCEIRFEKRYNCEHCQKSLKKYPDRLKQRKQALGCFDYTTRTHQIENIKYYRCPANYTSLDIDYFLYLHTQYERGIMPFSGALSDQPNKIVEVLQFIDIIKADKKEQAIKQQQAKAKRIKHHGR